MSESDADKRIGARIEVGGQAVLELGGAKVEGCIGNVSHRGVFFEGAVGTPEVGTEARLACNGGEPVVVKVAWTGDGGCGLTLIKPVPLR